MNKDTLKTIITEEVTAAIEGGNKPYVALKIERAYKVCGVTADGDTHFIVTSSRSRCITFYGHMLKDHSSVYIHLGIAHFDHRNVEELP